MLFSLNAFLYTNESISRQSHSDKIVQLHFNSKRVTLFLIISFILSKIINDFNYYAKLFDVLLFDVHHYNTLRRYLNVILQMFFSKIVVFYFLTVLFTLYIWYYLTIFCLLFHPVQLTWFIGCFVSMLISFSFSFFASSLFALLKIIALRKELNGLYNIVLFIKNIL